MAGPKKSLGQHWLRDRDVLAGIADEADLSKEDTVLEIGPGLGTLTSELLRRAGSVVAVEFDPDLARKLADGEHGFAFDEPGGRLEARVTMRMASQVARKSQPRSRTARGSSPGGQCFCSPSSARAAGRSRACS